jgi:uncharacterized surface protein with fasciclin (FAS1) repeats
MKAKLASRSAALVLATGLALAMTACGGREDSGSDDKGKTDDSQSQAEDNGSEAMAEPFGAACQDVPEDGDGSFDGMAQDKVATAASHNPALSTLVTAVGEADLADTLNSADDITVFAPANSAFDKIPEKDLNALLADKEALTDVLTYHVVGQTVTPDQLGADGPYDTLLKGEQVEASGSGKDFKVNGEASVVCGNVQTANATVYIIDTVLMPPAEQK